MFGIGTTEMIVFGIIAVILFGSRLPSVARSLGKSIVEFKKGMKDIENEVKSSVYSEPDKPDRLPRPQRAASPTLRTAEGGTRAGDVAISLAKVSSPCEYCARLDFCHRCASLVGLRAAG